MKKVLTLTILFAGGFISTALLAQSTAASSPNDMLDQIIQVGLSVAASIPAVGPYLAVTFKVLGVLSVVLTSASAVLMAAGAAFNIVGLSSVANWIQKFLPYVQKASMFNAPKKEEGKLS